MNSWGPFRLIERELWPGLSASFNYYRRDSYGALIEVNRALSVNDFTLFQLANPCGSNPTLVREASAARRTAPPYRRPCRSTC